MRNAIRRFIQDQSATISVEVILITPLLLWGYFGLFILYDGYRALSSNIRAGYTISDMISREDESPFTAAYFEGLNDLQDILTQSPHRTVLRVTAVTYDADTDDHEFDWSYSTAGQSAVTAGTVDAAIVPYLPPMSDGEQLIAVETWMAFVPFLDITLETLYDNTSHIDKTVFGPFYFESIVTTRPRFVPQLCFNSCF